MHASARARNLSRSVLVYLAGVSLGATLVHADDASFSAASEAAFVRIGVRVVDAVPAGHLSGDRAVRCSVEVVAECYARTSEGQGSTELDAVEAIAEAVADALQGQDLSITDHVGGTGATGHYLSLLDVATTAPPPVSGWARRIVTASGVYFLRRS